MKRKLFLSYVLLAAIVLGISIAAFWNNGYKFLYHQSDGYYLMQAKLLADTFHEYDIDSEDGYRTFAKEYSNKYNIRITLMDKEGNVLVDTSDDTISENHKTRKEVAKALKGEPSTVRRFSKTLGMDYAYSATLISSGDFEGVLRIAVPLTEITALDQVLTNSVIPIIIIAIVLAIIIAIVLTKILSKPISEISDAATKIAAGDYSIKIYSEDKGQIGQLAQSFNTMTSNLKSSTQKVARRNVELEAMLRSMGSGIVAIDDSNAILFYNDAFYSIIEANNKSLKGKSLYNVVRNAILFEAIDGVRATGEIQQREGNFVISENKLIRVTATPLVEEMGKTLGLLIIIEDITQIKKLERIRSEFVSNVSHELKTPLTSIKGFIDTLKNGAIEDEIVARRFLDIIDLEAERLYTLIQDILLLSEIESRRENEVALCNVNNCVEEVIELLISKVPENVTIKWKESGNLPLYPCDPDRIKQLIINLLDNAINYTETGAVSISCEEENEKLVIVVEDTGIGIDNEHLERIFERFYRVDKGRSRKKGGTGLGLSIVKHIVELYGGTICVESKVSEGTSFKIKLPYGRL